MPSWSPYVYTFDNPIKYIDPTGMEGEDPGKRFKISRNDCCGFNKPKTTRFSIRVGDSVGT